MFEEVEIRGSVMLKNRDILILILLLFIMGYVYIST